LECGPIKKSFSLAAPHVKSRARLSECYRNLVTRDLLQKAPLGEHCRAPKRFLGIVAAINEAYYIVKSSRENMKLLAAMAEFLTAKDSACDSGYTLLLLTESSQSRMPNKPPPEPSSMCTFALNVVQPIIVFWYPFCFISCQKLIGISVGCSLFLK